MKDDFAALIDKVGELKVTHDGYVNAMPRLKIAKEQAVKDLNEVNKQLVSKLTELDTAQAELADLRKALITEASQHKQKLSKELSDLQAAVKETTADLDRRKTEQDEQQTSLDKIETALNEKASHLTEREKSCKQDENRLAEWQKALQRDDDQNAEDRANNEGLESVLADRQLAQEARESKIVQDEAKTEELLRGAETASKQANELMAKAKSKLVDVEAMENGLIKREVALKTQKASLEKREIRLVDREQIQRSNLMA